MTRRRRRRWGILPAEKPAVAVEPVSGTESPGAVAQEAPPMPESKILRELLVNFEPHFGRLAIVEDGELVEFYLEHAATDQAVGNVYKGRVENVLPGMRAAFVNLGLEKNAFLYVDDAAAEDREGRKQRSIQELLKVGQEVVLQIVKEPIGSKGARVTTNVSLPGRYLVLTPYSDVIGVSRRIVDEAERERLRSIANKIRPKGMGIIVRTVAQGATQRQLARDLAYLRRIWARIRRKARTAAAPSLLHHELGLIGRAIRDHLDESVDHLIIDEPQAYARTREIVQSLSPELVDRVQLYQGKVPLFEARGIEAELERAMKRRVWLKCGGYLVIDETEAFTVIDVNSGKNVGSTDLSDTVLVTNKEAAVEIARQLRLRDISGIIVVDFIDMESEDHQKEIIRTFQQALKSDRTRVTVLGLTRLGLLEMTRKKVRESLLDQLTKVCPECDGRGHVPSEEVVARRFRQRIIAKLRDSGAEAILVESHPYVAAHLIGPGGANLKELEKETGRSVFIRGMRDTPMEQLNIVMVGSHDEVESRALPVHEGERLMVNVEERHATNPKNGIARRDGYVIDIEGAGDRVGQRLEVEITRALRTFATAHPVLAAQPAAVLAAASPVAEETTGKAVPKRSRRKSAAGITGNKGRSARPQNKRSPRPTPEMGEALTSDPTLLPMLPARPSLEEPPRPLMLPAAVEPGAGE